MGGGESVNDTEKGLMVTFVPPFLVPHSFIMADIVAAASATDTSPWTGGVFWPMTTDGDGDGDVVCLSNLPFLLLALTSLNEFNCGLLLPLTELPNPLDELGKLYPLI